MSSGLLSACLFLLLDASGSVDAAEHRLQREATAAALTSPEFLARVEYEGGIAVAVAEFSMGVTTLADWTTIRSPVEAAVLAEMLLTAPRKEDHSTATGEAVLFAVEQMKRAPGCERQVIDVSSDGRVNSGMLLEDAINVARAHGVMVNAIVIEDEPDVLEYYRNAVNGFALPATWDTYAQSLKMKMTLEIANAPRVLEPEFPRVARYDVFGWMGEPVWGFVGIPDAALVAVHPDYYARQRSSEVPGPGGFGTLAAGIVILLGAAWRRK